VRSVGSEVAEKTIFYRGASYTTESFPRVKLEVVVHDDVVERMISFLAVASKRAPLCDWDCIVIQVDDAVRVDGEIAEAAIAWGGRNSGRTSWFLRWTLYALRSVAMWETARPTRQPVPWE
jgi:nitrogen regulatory protein PII